MSNQYIAECYVAFNSISPAGEDGNREQIHLKLSRPTLNGKFIIFFFSVLFNKNYSFSLYVDTDCIRALEHRQGDKQARDFLKKLKQKTGSY